MFSLIITIISISLVAVLALATLYYGGSAFKSGAVRAEASTILLQGQQLLGASELYFLEKNKWPATIGDLVTGGYLKQIPTAQVTGLSQAIAVGTAWTMVPNFPTFTLVTNSSDVCSEVNLQATLKKKMVYTNPYSSLLAQCYGPVSNFNTVFRKDTTTPFTDPTNPDPSIPTPIATEPLPGDPISVQPPAIVLPVPLPVPVPVPPTTTGPAMDLGLDVSITPLSGDFGAIPFNSSLSKQFILKNNGTSLAYVYPWLNNNIRANGFDLIYTGCMSMRWGQLDPGVSCILTIKLTAAQDPAVITDSLTIEVANEDFSVDLYPTLALTGTPVAKTVALTADVNSLDFGYVRAGEFSTRNLTLTNTGTETVKIVQVLNPMDTSIYSNQINSSSWYYVNDPSKYSVLRAQTQTACATIAPGASCTMPLYFGPNKFGTLAEQLRLVVAGSSNSLLVNVALNGVGVDGGPPLAVYRVTNQFTRIGQESYGGGSTWLSPQNWLYDPYSLSAGEYSIGGQSDQDYVFVVQNTLSIPLSGFAQSTDNVGSGNVQLGGYAWGGPFNLTASTCPSTLPPGSSCTFTYNHPGRIQTGYSTHGSLLELYGFNALGDSASVYSYFNNLSAVSGSGSGGGVAGVGATNYIAEAGPVMAEVPVTSAPGSYNCAASTGNSSASSFNGCAVNTAKVAGGFGSCQVVGVEQSWAKSTGFYQSRISCVY